MPREMPETLYVNGRFTTTAEKVIGVEDRGFQFGDGIYEAVKFLRKRPIFIDDHFSRMAHGLDEIEILCPWDVASFRKLCSDILERTSHSEGLLYFQVTRGDTPRTHFYPGGLEPTVIAYSSPFKFPDAVRKERGFRVITASDLRWKRCDLKTLNLLGNVLAKRQAQKAAVDEALLVEGGEVREGASSSFFAVRNGRVLTHPADGTILPGTVRDRVITLALQNRIRVDERPVRDYELIGLEEAFVTSTTQGVMPVGEIDGRVIGNGRRGEVTARLQQLFDELEESEVAEGPVL